MLHPSITTSIADAGKLSGLSKSKIYELAATGSLDAVKAGRKTLIVTASLEKYLAGLPRAKIVGRTKRPAT